MDNDDVGLIRIRMGRIIGFGVIVKVLQVGEFRIRMVGLVWWIVRLFKDLDCWIVKEEEGFD